MNITYRSAAPEDIEPIYELCRRLINDFERSESIDYPRVMEWVRRKIEGSINEYTVIYADGKKAGYYHFFKNGGGQYEIDDLYVFPEFQNMGIGSGVIKKCCACVNDPVVLYVFIGNKRAVSLYKRSGFEILETVNGSRYLMRKENRKYYAAYDERYKTAHALGVSWSSGKSSPIVLEMLKKYNILSCRELLEVGCGEGRDSRAVLENGYNLTATDISEEAIEYCKKTMPQYKERFGVLDCLSESLDKPFDFIYSIAVIHMLVDDGDRDGFCRFIRSHLKPDGLALICTMGDGEFEMQSDISRAFEIQERDHESGKMMVAGTSCRMVSFKTFEDELSRNGLKLIEKGITSALPDFNSLMYAVVVRK